MKFCNKFCNFRTILLNKHDAEIKTQPYGKSTCSSLTKPNSLFIALYNKTRLPVVLCSNSRRCFETLRKICFPLCDKITILLDKR